MAGGPLAEAFVEAVREGCRRPWGPGLTTLVAYWNLTEAVRSSWHSLALERALGFTESGRVASGVRDPVTVLSSCAADGGLLQAAVKALEAVDRAECAGLLLGSLEVPSGVRVVPGVAEALARGADQRGMWTGDSELLADLSAEAMLEALSTGATEEDVAGNVAYAAALRLASDPAALPDFLYANALHQGLRRLETLGGPPEALLSALLGFGPGPLSPFAPEDPRELDELSFRDVDEAGAVTAGFLFGGGSPDALMERLVELLLREERSPEAVQCLDAAVQQYRFRRNTPEGVHILVAAARYLAWRCG